MFQSLSFAAVWGFHWQEEVGRWFISFDWILFQIQYCLKYIYDLGADVPKYLEFPHGTRVLYV